MLTLDIYQVRGRRVWHFFAPHHYLTDRFHGSYAFVAALPDGTLVGFTSSIVQPHPRVKHAYREHRTVVLPDYQGLGIGPRLGDWLGEWHRLRGERFYSRTAHPRLSAYRHESPLWRRLSGAVNPTSRTSTLCGGKYVASMSRLTHGYEYIGSPP